MALEHAILVSLSEKSGSGYELARRFDQSIGYFWHATHQQIYRVLKRMDALGWVERREITQSGKPDKNVYRVSEAGHTELRRWIAEPTESLQLRSELGLKIRGAEPGDLPTLLVDLKRQLGEHQARLDLYRQFEQHDFPSPGSLGGIKLNRYLVLRGGTLVEESFVSWLSEVIDKLSDSN